MSRKRSTGGIYYRLNTLGYWRYDSLDTEHGGVQLEILRLIQTSKTIRKINFTDRLIKEKSNNYNHHSVFES